MDFSKRTHRTRFRGAERRLLKIIGTQKVAQRREVPPFENGLGRSPFQNRSLGRLLKIIRQSFENASMKMSTAFYELYCGLLKIGLPPFQNGLAIF